MSDRDESMSIIEDIIDTEHEFGENDFTIRNISSHEGGGYYFTYIHNFQAKQYSANSISDIYDILYKIYKFFKTCGIQRRIRKSLEELDC